MNMKRMISFFFVLCFIFSLISCGADLESGKTGENENEISSDTGTEHTETADNKSTRTLSVTGAHAALDAIPVAQPGMSVEELREICTNYMRIQASVPWIPAEPYHYIIDEQHEEQFFKKNEVYGGLPYTRNGSSLYTFLEFYDDETGVLTVPQESYFDSILGNNCGVAVFWGWARFSTSIKYSGTRHMVEKNGVLRIGSYTYPDSVDDFAAYTTKRICEENGEQTMCESYALVQKGDGFVTYIEQGHAFMASCDAIVVRNDDGTIDPDKSGIYILEQHSTRVDRPLSMTDSQYQAILSGTPVAPQEPTVSGRGEKNSAVHNIGGVDNYFSFRKLLKAGYLPVTCAELQGKAIEKATVAVENLPTAATSAAELREAAVTSNYRISKVTYTFTDSEGKTAYETQDYGKEILMYSKPLYSNPVSLSQPVLKRELTKGETYTLTISVLVATGETLVAGVCSFNA